jgi:phosphomannomutase
MDTIDRIDRDLRHTFHQSVLREYDIRGIVGTTLSAADAYAIGRAYATAILRTGGKTIALGFDGRLSSPELAEAVAEGLLSTGVHVKRVGLGPTPMLYFAIKHLHADAGIMVTGSHNPPTWASASMATATASARSTAPAGSSGAISCWRSMPRRCWRPIRAA